MALQITTANWYGDGEMQFVNALNGTDGGVDYIRYLYNTPVAGTYTVALTYRSGAMDNTLVWSEEQGKITAGRQEAGTTDSTKNQTVTFEMLVETAGEGVLTLTTVAGKYAPMMDKM